ncbi:MAG: ATP-binding protein [Cyanobacteriota bacterium]|nr:ATP-binding protein [Cyanobacteriota bacterium]
MLVEFSVSNFKSIKEKQTLSLIADESNVKSDNVFTPIEGDDLRLLKSAVIYGANASGKSNIIEAFSNFLHFINQVNFDVNDDITFFKPFLLDSACSQKPTNFEFVFILDGVMYEYNLTFDRQEVIGESLYFHPQNKKEKLFERERSKVTLGDSFQNQDEVFKKAFKKSAYLSLVAAEEHQQMGKIYEYFEDYVVFSSNNTDIRKVLEVDITKKLLQNKNLKKRLAKLMRIADTQIDNFLIEESEVNFGEQSPEDIPDEVLKWIIDRHKYEILTVHKSYKNRHPASTVKFDLSEQESTGTKILYALGGLILFVLEMGDVIIVDELDNSLHPKLCKFLIKLFHNPASNPKNAQIIFATHETTLLDWELFRKDQIYFTEKDKYGATELFSAQDFEGVKDDVPFDEWYLQGKFGGKPNIKEMEFIFGDE